MAATLAFPTINVTPAAFRWSPEAARKAAEKAQFIRVGGPNGVTPRSITGAERWWKSADPNVNRDIFATGARISGTPENITAALRYAGVDENQIQQVLNQAITKDNYQTTMAAAYQQERDGRKGLKGTKPVAEGYTWDQIEWFSTNLNTARVSTKTGEQKGTVAAGGRGAGESLADKYHKLQPGKVLDVSGMDINTGKNVRTINQPKTTKAGKFGRTIPIFSNNADTYVAAIQRIFGPEGLNTYANEINFVRQSLAAPRAAVAGPLVAAPFRVPSPPRVPGQTLAPVPVFQPAVPTVASPAGLRTVGGGAIPQFAPLGTLLR